LPETSSQVRAEFETVRQSLSWRIGEMERHMLPVYSAIMDPSINPLKIMPPTQRFQTMLYLSIMWTTIFCAAAGAWVWYGEIVVAHLLVAAGFALTGLTFRAASRNARPLTSPSATSAAPAGRQPATVTGH
jgi:hypothetical protein